MKLLSKVVGESHDENKFLHKLFLTNTQVSKFGEAFANGSSANIKSSKTQLPKIGQSGGFLGRLLGQILKIGLSLIGNVLKPLANNVLVPLGLTAATSVTDAAIHKKIFGSGMRLSGLANQRKLIITNKEMNNIMKMVNSLEESSLLVKSVS